MNPSRVDRRGFLAAGLGSVAAASLSAELKPNLAIIDTHTHFYDPSRPQGVPWPGKASKALYRTVLPAEYRRFAEPLGIAGTIVVEASPWVEDNQWLLDLAAKEPFLLGIVGRLDTAADDFEKNLRRFAANPLYRGLRISHGELTAGLQGSLVKRCQHLIDLDLELDVNGGPTMAAEVATLAASLPKLRIVINHCSNVTIDGGAVPDVWKKAITAAAKCPNVFCKVSALVEHTSKTPAPREVDYYRPVIDTLWSCFGEDRLLFGSNWPVSDRGSSFEVLLAIVKEYFRAKGEAAAAKFFRSNSQTAYRWKPRG